MDGIVGGVPPDQVIAMALVGILHQYETALGDSTSILARILELEAHNEELVDSVLELRAELTRHDKALGYYQEKADVYRDRLEAVEKEARDNRAQCLGLVDAFDEHTDRLEAAEHAAQVNKSDLETSASGFGLLLTRVLCIERGEDPPELPPGFTEVVQ